MASSEPIYSLVRECKELRAEADYLIGLEDSGGDSNASNAALDRFDEKLVQLCAAHSQNRNAMFHRRAYLLPFLASYLDGCADLTAAVLDALLAGDEVARLRAKGGIA